MNLGVKGLTRAGSTVGCAIRNGFDIRLAHATCSKSTFSQPFQEKFISEVVRIASITIFHASKLCKAENLKLATLGSESVEGFTSV